jgi:hypothetical protein
VATVANASTTGAFAENLTEQLMKKLKNTAK